LIQKGFDGLGGPLAWYLEFFICDVLSKNPVLQYVPLPTPVFHYLPDRCSPDIVRDMVAVKGTVRYFEMKLGHRGDQAHSRLDCHHKEHPDRTLMEMA